MNDLKTTIRRVLAASLIATGGVVPTTVVTAAAPLAPLQPPQIEQSNDLLNYSMRQAGAEVSSIKNIESISDWQTLDTKHLILKINNAQRYLLTLDDPCMHLRGARLVGVSMTNQEIWADFDHVAADGWECRIDTITRLGGSQS